MEKIAVENMKFSGKKIKYSRMEDVFAVKKPVKTVEIPMGYHTHALSIGQKGEIPGDILDNLSLS